ncbi:hypothetical protein Dsin_024334 [Dipteronia sinensis]|uniref:BHLH domain-containing protein n=1 Tax=Dipteronia sinensis TaxID=43782 RepID=A0AAE0DXA6_9ROSI|nr:hypothetical protein Dsin_024334 [Dipteronia sinensis]
MEHMGAICEGEWSLSGMYSNEEADFMAQLLGNCPIPSEIDGSGNQSTFWPGHGSSSMNMAGVVNQTNSYFNFDLGNSNSSFCFSQGSSYSGGSGSVFFPSSSQESYYLSDSNPIMSMDFCLGDGINTTSYLIEGEGGDDHCSNGQEMSDGNADHHEAQQSGGGNYQLLPELGLSVKSLQPKMESEKQQEAPEPVLKEEKLNNPSENSKKRSRNTADVQKNKRNVRSKKNQKACVTTNNNIIDQQEDNNNNNNAGLNWPTSSGCCSEDDSNASQEPNGGGETESGKAGALNLNGKTRASRGSATDPQSLYARKRRERINERLRILQNLVPNGTKVDISTMLEEAVQYVKFLQLQIKLLSSDDLWMYAPIAYNGMNLGLDLNLMTATTPRLS